MRELFSSDTVRVSETDDGRTLVEFQPAEERPVEVLGADGQFLSLASPPRGLRFRAAPLPAVVCTLPAALADAVGTLLAFRPEFGASTRVLGETGEVLAPREQVEAVRGFLARLQTLLRPEGEP